MSSPQEPHLPGPTGPGQQQLADPGPEADPRPAYGQQPGRYAGSTPFGLPGEQPPARRRPKLWVVLTAIGGVLLLVLLGVVILVNVAGSATNKAKGLADGFTKLVIAGDSARAYDDYLDPALKEQISKETFISGIASLKMDGSCVPAYNDVTVGTEDGIKAADIAGIITCDGKKVDLAYRFEGTDELKMTNIKLRPAA